MGPYQLRHLKLQCKHEQPFTGYMQWWADSKAAPVSPMSRSRCVKTPPRECAWELGLASNLEAGGFFCDYATHACPHALAGLEDADSHAVNCLWERGQCKKLQVSLGTGGGLQTIPSQA